MEVSVCVAIVKDGMCCYSNSKDGSNSVCVAIVNSARMEVTVYVLLCKDGSNSVCVAIVNSARMEVTVYVLL